MTCFLFFANFAFAQTKNVRGIVVNEAGETLPGVSVIIPETQNGATTDGNGRFEISVPQSTQSLLFKYIGMENITAPIQQGEMKIVMTELQNQLDEVVVLAYGTSKRSGLTGAIATVSSKDMELRPITNVANALEGTLGVITTSSTGQPGSDPTIRIRGIGTVNGSNSPLIVIDDVTFEGNLSDINPSDVESMSILKDASSAALYGNRAANGVILITTKRGKSDKPRISLDINHGINFRGISDYDRMGPDQWMEATWIAYRNQFLSTQKGMTVSEANALTNKEIVSNYYKYNIYDKPDDQLFDASGKLQGNIRPGYLNDLDWFDAGTRDGIRKEYGISASGRFSKKSDYYFSVSYLDEQGYAKNAEFKRLAARTRINVTPNSWFNTEFSLNGTNQERSSMDVDGGGYLNLFSNARSMSPIYPVHLHDITTGEYILDTQGNKQFDSGVTYNRPQMNKRHTIWESELNKDITNRKTLQGHLKSKVTFLNDFEFRLNAEFNTRISENDIYENAIIGDGAGNNGRAGYTDYRYKNYTIQEQLYWEHVYNDKHSIDVLAAHENYYYNYMYAYGRVSSEIFAGMPYLVNFTTPVTTTGYEQNYRLESYLSRIRYNYEEKYFFDASFRRDGSSRLYKPSRWGNFWSVGGSYVLSKEEFMQNLRGKLDMLKLRANYGETGNDNSVGYYGYMALYSITKNGTEGALTKSQLEALDISWEAATSFGLAVDGRLFDKLNFSIEYYDKRNRDLLFDVNLPTSAGNVDTGETSPKVSKNIGTVSNKGIEVSLMADLIKHKDFLWYAGLDVATLKNKILKLPEENRENGIIDGTKKYTEGHGIYDFWTYQYVGVDMMNGRSLYKLNDETYYIADRANEAETRTVVPADQTVRINDVDYVYKTTYAKRDFYGSAHPKLYGSFRTGVNYKGIGLEALLTYSLGNKVYDNPYSSLLSIGGSSPSALHKDLTKSWNGVPEGMTETSPNRIDKDATPILDPTYSPDVNATSTRFLIDGSYLMFKSIRASYSLPKKLIKSVDLSNVRINASAENLFLLTARKGLNSQMSTNGIVSNYAPFMRSISLGLSVEF
jgi:TonB-linked SusC/RagA family outer membrane protein